MEDVESMLKASSYSLDEQEVEMKTAADQSQAAAPDTNLHQFDASRLKRLTVNAAMLDESNFEISSTVARNTSEYDEQIEIIDLTMDDNEQDDDDDHNEAMVSSSMYPLFQNKWTTNRRKNLAAFAAIGSS